MQSSYRINEFTTNIETEVHRLKGQVDLFFDKEFAKFCEIGLRDGQKIIECGCGPGYLLSRILEIFPGCRATGLEIDPYLVEILKTNAQSAGKKLFDVAAGSITDTGLPDNSFDFAIARLVLEHLPDAEAALHELQRILKPGGKLAVVSNDFSLHLLTYPHIPELDTLYAAYCASQDKKGGNPRVGRTLPVLLHKTDFIRITLDVICAHSTLHSEKAFFKAEDVHISARLVKEGYLAKETLDILAGKWYALLKTEGHAIYRQLFIAGAEKSAETMADNSSKQPAAGAAVPAAEKDREYADIIKQLRAAPSAARSALLETYLVNTLAEVLEHDPAGIAKDLSFNRMGIDSISAVEFINILLTDFNLEISFSDLLQSLTISTLAGKICLSLEL